MVPDFKCDDDILCKFIDHSPEMGKITYIDRAGGRIKVEMVEGQFDGGYIWFKFSEVSKEPI